MRIELITKTELINFIKNPHYRQLQHLPISPQRAWSQAHNPRALPDDAVLALAYTGQGKLAGYLGALPDAIWGERMAWLSCIWVDHRLRGSGIAKGLLQAMHRAWQGRLGATEFTEAAGRLYESSGCLKHWTELKGLRCYFRPNSSYLMAQRRPGLLPLLRCADALLRPLNALRLGLFHSFKNNIFFEYVNNWSKSDIEWMRRIGGAECSQKTETDFYWLQHYPWLIGGGVADAYSRRYHFSSVTQRYDFFDLRLRDDQGQTIAALLLSVRDRHLQVQYAYFEDRHVEAVARVLYELLYKGGLDMLTTYHPALCAYFEKVRTPFMGLRRRKRRFMLGNPLMEIFGEREPILQAGDADAGFI